MNVFRKILLTIKNIFEKKEEVKLLQEPTNNKNNFIESLKTNITKKSENKKVETLVCNGDGLGIQKKISF
jgi:hypothetical protein